MNIDYERKFSFNITLKESNLYDLLLELKHLDAEGNESLKELESNILQSIESHKDNILITSE